MISSEYSIEQSIQMLSILGVNRAQISAHGLWPDHVRHHFGNDVEFVFNNYGILFARVVCSGMISWKGPIDIDSFWKTKISQSISYQCARYLKLLQKNNGMKNVAHLLCKFYKFAYVCNKL